MFSAHLQVFHQHQRLRQRVSHVLDALPGEVQDDFLSDPRFHISLDNYAPGLGSSVFLAVPGGAGEGSRNVVLRPRLSECSEAFAHYVIAHELAHAFLRNGPWGDITDIEHAANALAESWGFPRPDERPWDFI